MTSPYLLTPELVAAQRTTLVQRLKAAPYIIVLPPHRVQTPTGRVEVLKLDLGES